MVFRRRYSNAWASLAFLLVYVSVTIIGALGWVFNIIKLCSMDSSHPGLFVVRIVGIFIPPVGAIMGWLS